MMLFKSGEEKSYMRREKNPTNCMTDGHIYVKTCLKKTDQQQQKIRRKKQKKDDGHLSNKLISQ